MEAINLDRVGISLRSPSGVASLIMGTLIGMEVVSYMCERWVVLQSGDDMSSADRHSIWMLLIVLMLEIAMIYLIACDLWVRECIIVLGTVILSAYVNWWMHRSFHQENSHLRQYQWFQQAQARHQLHHSQPHTNYGIISHFADQCCGTYQEVTSI